MCIPPHLVYGFCRHFQGQQLSATWSTVYRTLESSHTRGNPCPMGVCPPQTKLSSNCWATALPLHQHQANVEANTMHLPPRYVTIVHPLQFSTTLPHAWRHQGRPVVHGSHNCRDEDSLSRASSVSPTASSKKPSCQLCRQATNFGGKKGKHGADYHAKRHLPWRPSGHHGKCY